MPVTVPMHVLTNCPRALNMHWYNKRHDAVLAVISKFMAEILPDGYQLLADLLQFQPYVSPPPTMPQLISGLTPTSNTNQEIWVIKLTVCFETGYEEARTWKADQYTDLMEHIAETPLDGTLVTLEVGSCGYLSLPSFHKIKQQLLEHSKKQSEAFLINVAQTTICGSHKIRVTRNWTDSDSQHHHP